MKKKHQPGCPCCSCGTIRVTVTVCGGGGGLPLTSTALSGATVSVYDGTATLVGTATTDGGGIAEIDIPSAADYTVVVAKTGQVTTTKTVSVTCIQNNLAVTMGRGVRVVVSGCGCGVSGATVTLTRAVAGYSETVTSNSFGFAEFTVPISALQTYSYSITATGYTSPATGTITIPNPHNCFHVATVTLAVPSGHWCYGGAPAVCIGTIPATLDVTFPVDARFGTLSGATVAVPKLATNSSTLFYRGDFPVSGEDSGFYTDANFTNDYIRVQILFNPAGDSCAQPGASIFLYGSTGPGTTPTNAVASSVKSSGTAVCPVAFATSQYNFTNSGGTTVVVGTFTVAE